MAPRYLIDAHAHFHWSRSRDDFARYNRSRLDAGETIGITCHVASILGTWGRTSPTYFASPADVTAGNDAMYTIAREQSHRVRAFVHVNPNHTDHALREIERGVAAGAIGVKLSASRRADDALVDAIADEAGRRGLPVLHHVWQHRQREWGNQEASDAVELVRLAARHPGTNFILAHIGGGGDWAHSIDVLRDAPNVFPDTSGSGVDRGMLDAYLTALGAPRLLWAADLTICTGLAKLQALQVIGMPQDDLDDICWRNATRIFPPESFVLP
ncbi:MAG TPA: amidohydrolase family protein [Gemmatimonadaceae bacterium]|nr:amidohydrolase family protein [Gemmatimonadaceae bacterium]